MIRTQQKEWVSAQKILSTQLQIVQDLPSRPPITFVPCKAQSHRPQWAHMPVRNDVSRAAPLFSPFSSLPEPELHRDTQDAGHF